MRTPWLTCLTALLLGAAAWPARADDDSPVRPAGFGEPNTPRALFDWPARPAPGHYAPGLFDDQPACDAPFPDPPRPHRTGFFTVGGGVSFLEPNFDANPAFFLTRGTDRRVVEFAHDTEANPLAWIGYTAANGYGVRGRYMGFEGTATASAVIDPASGVTLIPATPLFLGLLDLPGGTITATNEVSVDTIDIEGTYTWTEYRWWFQVGAGVRYANLRQNYNATVVGDAIIGTATLQSNNGFNGAGPSLSFETKRRLAESRFALYGNVHGAALFGRRSDEFYATVTSGLGSQQFVRRRNRVTPFGEGEVGLEFCCSPGPCQLFVQAGFLAQGWWNAGNATNFDPIENRFDGDSTFGLVGAAFRLGLTF